MKNNKGITLIALVVTIIVLLILAGVSIAMLTGQNGILNRASEASYESKLQNAAESMSYNVTEALTAHYNKSYVTGNTTDTSKDTIAEAIKQGITDSISDGKSKADTSITVTDTSTVAPDATATDGKKITGNVKLVYNSHVKYGIVTNSGISWNKVDDKTGITE